MEYLGYFFAIIIGLVMGLIGGGGSILSVPVFVYLFHYDAITATGYSLFVVGITSLFGAGGFMKEKLVNYKTAFLFGIPSILGVLFSRRVILPHLPHYIINKWGIVLTKETFLLLLFAVLMLISSYKMISKADRSIIRKATDINFTLLISQGLLVGIITGLIGAGGGFLIVPALVMLLKLNMKEAVATSLFIISMNSLIGFGSSMDKLLVDWNFLLIFSALSIAGIIVGVRLAKKIEGKKLRPFFGWFVLIKGIYVILRETIFQG